MSGLDRAGAQNFFNQIQQLWIEPELEKRKLKNPLPPDFKIWKCLIRIPKNQPPIVEFNDEVGFMVEVGELAPGISMTEGKPIYLHEVVELGRVLPPSVNDEPVAFIFIYWNGFSYAGVFDFTPNSPDFNPEEYDFQAEKVISDYLKSYFKEITVRMSETMQSKLREIGLWTVTALLPYPISKIVERVGEGALLEARQLLVDYCDPGFLSYLVESWKPISVFDGRMTIFDEALFAHSHGRYYASIYTLVPQIEGVISDWLYVIHLPGDVKWRASSKIGQFREAVEAVPDFEYAYRSALASVTKFLLEGQPAQEFRGHLKSW